jgi:hypothetical protein
MRVHLVFLGAHVMPHPLLGPVFARLDRFVDQWAAAWAQFGTDEAGVATYVGLLDDVKLDLTSIGGTEIVLKNQFKLYLVLDHIIFLNALGRELVERMPAKAAWMPAAA